jgi:Acyl-CoA carboxylase epsilon subunit
MIQITKGNPTREEIAALVAVLAVASATTQSGPIGSTAAGWRRSALLAQLNPAELGRRDRRWRPRSAGWSRVGPAHAPVPDRVQLGRNPQRELTPDSWPRTRHYVVSRDIVGRR